MGFLLHRGEETLMKFFIFFFFFTSPGKPFAGFRPDTSFLQDWGLYFACIKNVHIQPTRGAG